MHEYERQDTTKTLAEGIAEYYEQNPHLSKIRGMSPQAQDFFRCHDTAHVVFGCNTSLPHEAVVKLSSLFGTTAGLSVLKGYALHESTKIYRELVVKDIVGTFLKAAVIAPENSDAVLSSAQTLAVERILAVPQYTAWSSPFGVWHSCCRV